MGLKDKNRQGGGEDRPWGLGLDCEDRGGGGLTGRKGWPSFLVTICRWHWILNRAQCRHWTAGSHSFSGGYISPHLAPLRKSSSNRSRLCKLQLEDPSFPGAEFSRWWHCSSTKKRRQTPREEVTLGCRHGQALGQRLCLIPKDSLS